MTYLLFEKAAIAENTTHRERKVDDKAITRRRKQNQISIRVCRLTGDNEGVRRQKK
jgi:hypothetical protein